MALSSAQASPGSARSRAVRARLQARRTEIEQALLVRVYGVADPIESGDLSYVEGFRAAAAEAVDFGLATLQSSQDRLPLVPPILLGQARLAARNGVGLDTVLRRYAAGHAILVDFLVEEAQSDETLPAAELRRMLATGSSAFDHLLAAVGQEHGRELSACAIRPPDGRLVERVRRLLAGEPVDTTDLPYELDNWHIGVVVQGEGAGRRLRSLAQELSLHALIAENPGGPTWGWLGARRRPDPRDVVRLLHSPQALPAAVGEAGKGLAGWRFTHRQAAVAFSVLKPGDESPVQYAEVALLATAIRDELLALSLRELFIAPLDAERDGGKAARETLRAYFQADHRVSSAAAALGIKRHTVTKRLRTIEARLGRSLVEFAAEIEITLRLEERELGA